MDKKIVGANAGKVWHALMRLMEFRFPNLPGK